MGSTLEVEEVEEQIEVFEEEEEIEETATLKLPEYDNVTKEELEEIAEYLNVYEDIEEEDGYMTKRKIYDYLDDYLNE